MNATGRLAHLRTVAVRRRIGIALACAAPAAVALVALATVASGVRAAAAVAVLAMLVSGIVALVIARRTDARWLAHRLDACVAAMEDSATLLFRAPATLAPLQALQQARLRRRLDGIEAVVAPPWPRRALAGGAIIAVLLALVAVVTLRTGSASKPGVHAPEVATDARLTRVADVAITVEPPPYTSLPAREEHVLDLRVPQDARLQWRLRFDPAPGTAALVFHDGRRVALRRDGSRWLGEARFDVSALYRIETTGAPPPEDDALHRIDVMADHPPGIRVLQPEQRPVLLEPGQKTQEIAFEASDDHAVARAELDLTLAQGTGENIAFKERTIALDGEELDGPRKLRYRHMLDIAALGLSQGDEVVVRIVVADNREPAANVTRSASIVLRLPADAAQETTGLEGVVQHAMPAYFRSQRQIVIDTEALLEAMPTLDAQTVLARSDSIGVDQKILRLRYGQFLGEESETGAEQAQRGAHAPGQVDALAAAHPSQEHAPAAAPVFGREGDTVAEYGHVHDIAEAATLLDAATRETLRAALDAMWQAELPLRQGRPADALAPEHRALDLIKKVQQSTRIYLERVGLELPVADESRRLSGERKGVSDRAGSLRAAAREDAPVASLWRVLAARDAQPDWDAAETWLRAHAPDALGVFAALDRARRMPACEDCRAALRAQLWPLLATPAAAVQPRTAPDAAGERYLDAIERAPEASP